MSTDIVHTIRFDARLETYKSFFDHQWARENNRRAEGTAFEQAMFALGVNWKSAANTSAMPWILIDALRGLWTGFMSAHQPFGSKLVSVLRDRLIDEMGNSLSNMRRQQLAAAIECIGR